MIIIDLVFNLALLISVSVLSGFFVRRWARNTLTGILIQGVLFGLVALLGMINPFTVSPGLIFDGRSVVLSLCALFFGPVAGAIAATIALIYRISIGGPGEAMGISVIVFSTIVGCIFYFPVKRGKLEIKTLFLIIVGIIVHLGMVGFILLVPQSMRMDTFKALTPTVLGIYPLATALIGKILQDQADSAERKNAEEKLKASEALYQDLYEYAPDMYMSIDPHTKSIIKCNKTLAETTGYTKEELIGKPIFDLYHPEYHENAKDAFQQFLSTGRVNDVELKVTKKNGESIYVNLNVTAVYDDFGKIIASRSSWRNITDQYKANEEILRLNVELEKRVEERTRQLELKNKELAFHVKEIEQFTYIASHDLQEPLRTMTSFTQLLKEDYKIDETGDKYITFIHQSALRMRDLVQGLLDYTLLGKESVKTTIDLRKTIKDVLADMEESIKDTNAAVNVTELPAIFAYPVELRLLFQNLINNAIKFHRKGIPPVIEISAKENAKGWTFSIADNGIGINEKDKEKVFIIFKRMHNHNEYKGSGIGLAHCKKIVELHGGKIWVVPNAPHGSIFRFTIPEGRGKGNEGMRE